MAGVAGDLHDLVVEEGPRSAGAGQGDKRGRRPVSKPVVAQLSILDATLDNRTTQP